MWEGKQPYMHNRFIDDLRDTLPHLLGWRIPLLSTALSLTVIAWLWPLLSTSTTYPEFIVARHSWSGESIDLAINAFRALMVLLLVTYLAINALCVFLFKRRAITLDAIRTALDLLLLSLAAGVGMLLVRAEPVSFHVWTMALITASALSCAFVIQRKDRPSPITEEWILSLAGVLFFSVFAGFGLAIAASSFLSGWVAVPVRVMQVLALGPYLLAVLWVGVQIVWPRGDVLERRLLGSLWAVQFIVPFLVFGLLPVRLSHQGVALPYAFPALLTGVLLVFVVLSWRWLLKKRHATSSGRALVSPFTIVAIAIFIGAVSRTYPSLWSDDFHLGEQLLPWHQWVEFGKVPFVDFAPFHGFMHLLSGALNSLFFDGTAANYINTMNLLFGLASGLTCWAVHRIAGVRIALLCAMMALPMAFYMNRLVFLVPAFLLLAMPGLTRHALRWLVVWCVLGVFLVFYNTVAGVSFVLATIPFGLWQAWSLWRRSPATFLRLVFGGLLVVAIALAIPPIRHMTLGYMTFILENRPAYDVLWSIPWAFGFGDTPFADGLFSNYYLYDLARFAWVPVMALAAYLLWREWVMTRKLSVQGAYLFVGGILLLTLLTGYTLRRIDPATAGRPGSIAYIALAFLLPVYLGLAFPQRKQVITLGVAFYAGLLTLFMPIDQRWDIQSLYWKTFRAVDVPGNLAMVDGRDLSMPRLGRMFPDRERLESMVRFGKALASVLEDDQTYYDMTNRQLLYVMHNRPVPTRYAAVGNPGNAVKQQRVIDQLMKERPAAVFIDPMMIIDQRPNLRPYYIYRYVLLNYAPVEQDSFTFMVNEASPAYDRRLNRAEAVERLASLFADYNLHRLPSEWGRSWDGLQHRARRIADIQPSSENSAATTYALSTQDMAGADADLLVIEVEDASSSRSFTLTWIADGRESFEPVLFSGAGHTFIVPVGSFPQWLLAERIEAITVETDPPADLKAVSLWLRQEVNTQ